MGSGVVDDGCVLGVFIVFFLSSTSRQGDEWVHFDIYLRSVVSISDDGCGGRGGQGRATVPTLRVGASPIPTEARGTQWIWTVVMNKCIRYFGKLQGF